MTRGPSAASAWGLTDFFRENFKWRVPIDDESTLSVTWKYTRVPKEREPCVQKSIPTLNGPIKDADGKWIDTHVMNQDFLAWVGQGVIADRTTEHLGASDCSIVAIRRRFFEELETIAAGGEAEGILRDPKKRPYRVADGLSRTGRHEPYRRRDHGPSDFAAVLRLLRFLGWTARVCEQASLGSDGFRGA